MHSRIYVRFCALLIFIWTCPTLAAIKPGSIFNLASSCGKRGLSDIPGGLSRYFDEAQRQLKDVLAGIEAARHATTIPTHKAFQCMLSACNAVGIWPEQQADGQ